nr:ATP-binding protein [Methanocella sp. CWC-04]
MMTLDLKGFKDLFENLPEAVIVIGADKKTVRLFNRAAGKYFADQGRSITGKDVYSLLGESSKKRVVTLIEEAVPGTAAGPVSLEVMHGGETLFMDCMGVQAILGGENCFILTMHPVTQEKAVSGAGKFYTRVMFENIFNDMPAGILLLDDRLNVKKFNDYAARIFSTYLGSDLSSMTGSDISSVISDEKILSKVREAHSDKKVIKVYGYKLPGRLTHSNDINIDLVASPVIGMGGNLAGINIFILDVSDREEQLEEIKRSKTEAEFYVDLMSHDIRNFNQISMGYIELLTLSTNFNETEMHYLEKAQKGVMGSNKLIENIKKIRKIREEAHRNIVRMELEEVIKKDIKDLKKAFPEETIVVNTSIGPEEHYVMANEFIHDVFMHLLENAVKYDPHSEKMIDLGISEVVEDGNEFWEVRVADHGTGIPDEKKPILFDRMTKTTRGSGVGLSIVSVIVDKYGGYISVDNRVPGDVKKGTVFYVKLPKA